MMTMFPNLETALEWAVPQSECTPSDHDEMVAGDLPSTSCPDNPDNLTANVEPNS